MNYWKIAKIVCASGGGKDVQGNLWLQISMLALQENDICH